MSNKFPTGRAFQRLNETPLDETMIFDTLVQAEYYACCDPTAYSGQIIHVKDARTLEEIKNNINIYEDSFYIDYHYKLKPICSFTYKAMNAFFDLMYDMELTESNKEKLDTLRSLMLENYTIAPDELSLDYRKYPWISKLYSENQIALKMTQSTEEGLIGKYWSTDAFVVIEGSEYTIENITIQEDGIETYYKIINLNNTPTKVSFKYGNYIEKVIHMCDTSKITDMNSMFSDCKSLIYIDLYNFNTSNVTNMYMMFSTCSSMVTLDVSKFNTSKVTNMQFIFAYNNSLKSINLNGLDLSKVETMDGAFRQCKSLISIDMSTCKIDSLNLFRNGFNSCTSLVSVNLSGLNMPRLFYVNNLFEGCTSLKSVNLSNSNVSNWGNAQGLFKGCSSLTEIDLTNCSFRESFSTSYTDEFFDGCSSLELDNINMTGCPESTVTLITDLYDNRVL